MTTPPDPIPAAERVHAARASAWPAWMLGPSAIFRAFHAQLERVATSDVQVLFEGESGSGKNLAARALHRASPRAAGPLVEVDLGALAPTLLEAELFGHEAGAFTGAQRARVGRFVRANGGTLVLDGIDRLPEALQAKLLRALQERTVEPLGSEALVPIDARIVATTQSDLTALVKAGKFRQDLYYRLAVVRMRVPPLRERASDLPSMIAVLAEDVGRRLGVPARRVGPDALARLARHAWPGNLRELENALERLLVVVPPGGEQEITAGELAFLDEAAAGVPERLAAEALAHGVTLAQLESALLQAALRSQRGNIAAAARQVGISRRTFEMRHPRASEPDAEGDA